MTDHKALNALRQKQNINCDRLERWAIFLSQYDFELVYKPGRLHQNADALSRLIDNDNTNESEIPFKTPRYYRLQAHVSTQTPNDGDTENEVEVFAVQNVESDIPQLNYNIIRAEQIADADLAEKINFLQNGITNGKTPERMRAETKGYELDGTSLLRLKPKGSCPARICIPDTLKTNIIQLAHDNSTSMHLGFHKTWKRVANVAYWKYLKNDVMQYVKNCEDCAISKHYGATLQSSLTPLPVPTEPFQYIAADIMHMPKSNKGNQYILAFICHFSKFLITYALDSTDAKTIADKFVNDLCRWISFPKYLLTDQGSNFKADHLQAILDQYKVNKIFSVPYHHQTNGLIERSFRTLRQGFRVFCNKNPEEWDTY